MSKYSTNFAPEIKQNGNRNKNMNQIISNINMMNYKESAKAALKEGCQWFQLRMDDASDKEIVNVAKSIKELCDEYHAYFIIEDHVHLVKTIKANGVHLNNENVNEARKTLGCRYIISVNSDVYGDTDNSYAQGADSTYEAKKSMNVCKMQINCREGYISHIA